MTPERSAQASTIIDNHRVRVTEWRLPPGTATGHHRHELDYVVVPMTTGTLVIRDVEGDRDNNLIAGAPYYRDSGAEHNVINDDGHEIVFIEIESKSA